MLSPWRNHFRSLRPLATYSISDIVSQLYPKGRAGVAKNRERLCSALQRSSVGFGPGDRPVGSGTAYFGFRWMAVSIVSPEQFRTPSIPTDTQMLGRIYPAFADKLDLLPLTTIEPRDIHCFLVGLSIWRPRPRVKQRRRRPRKLPDPGPCGMGQALFG